MVELLELAGSCYLPAFLSLRQLLDREAATAEGSVRHLVLLQEPCKALEKAAPRVKHSALHPAVLLVKSAPIHPVSWISTHQ